MSVEQVAELVQRGRLEPIPPDISGAVAMLEEARLHLQSADLIASSDPNGSYALFYDGARKAVTAHMLASGYRVTRHRLGAHPAVIDYAEAIIGADRYRRDVRSFDRIRRNRNRSEYGIAMFGSADIRTDLAHARRIVQAVEEQWSPQ